MLKKTLLALAVAAVASSASAMTLEVTKDGVLANEFVTNVLASQTKQDVLDKTTLEGVVDVIFKQDGTEPELKNAGEIILKLAGDAQFNAEKVAALLSIPAADLANTDFVEGIYSIAGADAAAIAVGNLVTTGPELAKVFKIDNDGVTSTVRYSLDSGNQRLSLKLADNVETAVTELVRVRFDFTDAVLGQAFKLTSGSTSQVRMSVGALQNASYTADPQNTPVLFRTENLFKVVQDALQNGKDKTALVSTTYTQWNDVANGGLRSVEFTNNTTKQNIQYKHLKISLAGDFTGIATKDGKLAAQDGSATVWSVSNGVASALYSDITGQQDANFDGATEDLPLELPSLFIADNNAESIPAQGFELTVETIDNATFVPYKQTIGNAFVVVRDGMKFDTVTTGTSSSNVIYIRDVSKTLPAEGGKIFVTITEYDAHDLETGGKGTDLVTRAVLPTRLPSNGAVTLTPAGIAAALGVESTPARQARFFFEVETNQGEAAVKKQTAEGVDIQTGRSQTVTDFTL
ncbi:TPA: S-layer protein [Vibrio vulnificus]|nr:S-layer protein [Vibrio vulnificus]